MREFEGWIEDIDDQLVEDISTCFKDETVDGVTVKVPKTAQGVNAQKLWNEDGTAAEQNHLIQLVTPFQRLDNSRMCSSVFVRA